MSDSEDVEVLNEDYGLWEGYIDHLKEDRGIDEIWRSQLDALENGLLDEENFVMVSAPGTGKTLAAEFVMVNEWVSRRNTSVFLVPYKELAKEKFQDFKSNIGSLGLDVSISVGSDRTDPKELFDAQIAVLTYEKFDFYLRNFPGYVEEAGCVVVDEFHKVSDPSRGPSLEIAINRLKENHPEKRIVGLSATAPNAKQLSEWINGSYSDTGEWRKNELIEGICIDGEGETVFFDDEDEIKEDYDTYLENYKFDSIIDYIQNKDKQCLVFANTRGVAKETAQKLSEYIETHPKSFDIELDKKELHSLREDIQNLPYSESQNLKMCKSLIKQGVGLHHAGLPRQVQDIITRGFREGYLNTIVATTTLAAGVNLPVQRIFILEPRLGGSGDYGRDMTVAEYKNLAGRAGRPKYSDEKGESVLYEESAIKAESLLNNYILDDPERVESSIDIKENPSVVLNLLQNNETISESIRFLETSLLGLQTDIEKENIEEDFKITVEELEAFNMIDQGEEGFELTSLGEASSRKLIHPRTVYTTINYLDSCEELNPYDLFTTLVGSPDFDNVGRFWKKIPIEDEKEKMEDCCLTHLKDDKFRRSRLTAASATKWIQGKNLSEILNELPVDESYWGVSDISDRMCPAIVRVIKNLSEILEEARPDLFEEYAEDLDTLSLRVQNGLKEKEVEFAKSNITTERGLIRNLIHNGDINTPKEIIDEDLVDIPMKGRHAYEIKKRAIYNVLEGRQRQKELILLEAENDNLDKNRFRKILTSDRMDFQRICLECLESIECLDVERVDDSSGQKKEPEAIVRIEKDGNYLKDDQAETFEIAIECKSKKNLEGKVGSSKATDVVRKAPQAQSKVTLGTPEFTKSVDDDALKNSVLALDSIGFSNLLLEVEREGISPTDLKKFFDQSGYVKKSEIKKIIN